MPRAISKATWDQIKIARAAGASFGELAKRTVVCPDSFPARARARKQSARRGIGHGIHQNFRNLPKVTY